MDWLKRLPYENILLDISLVVVAFALPSSTNLISGNLTAAFWIAAPFQVLALFCAFFGRDGDGQGPRSPDWLSIAYVVNAIFAVGSFLWLFLVAFAVERQTGEFPYWGFRLAFLVALFGGILVFGLRLGMPDGDPVSLKVRYLMVAVIFVFLTFTESLLEASINISSPGKLTVIVATCISYLPVRLAFAFQPPFSYWDLISAIVCFLAYLYTIL